ncbi:MAG: hypothetical protein COW00_11790 [Bdellovibrio sp. CG12_big_fil_rev_8_21_14_0_65_39_13]|nr:MAG: hypothetical protein COW78_12020 [Bdellovibrio sp. CG22_combo_CG10-13_8_21_14_all_39_27]PIQ59187.1 MAG: hypothetical protein COW00_11790 [Bdellovibrio sp. CG12_big_fil_rev_8_21_14_0_65_39_13]PIR32715.1 MAG: hypothetical protein COV37_18945 [Bdellovibrio sp. CG11_big_fil_rev_8_21_14_0_20_39_38]
MIGYNTSKISVENIRKALNEVKFYYRFKDLVNDTRDTIHSIPRRCENIQTSKGLEIYIGVTSDIGFYDRILSHLKTKGHSFFVILGRVPIERSKSFEKHAIRLFKKLHDSECLCVSNKSNIGYCRKTAKGLTLDTAIFYMTFKMNPKLGDEIPNRMSKYVKNEIKSYLTPDLPPEITTNEFNKVVDGIDNRQIYGRFNWHPSCFV